MSTERYPTFIPLVSGDVTGEPLDNVTHTVTTSVFPYTMRNEATDVAFSKKSASKMRYLTWCDSLFLLCSSEDFLLLSASAVIHLSFRENNNIDVTPESALFFPRTMNIMRNNATDLIFQTKMRSLGKQKMLRCKRKCFSRRKNFSSASAVILSTFPMR